MYILIDVSAVGTRFMTLAALIVRLYQSCNYPAWSMCDCMLHARNAIMLRQTSEAQDAQ